MKWLRKRLKAGAESDEANSPIFLMMGSLRDCSRKDAQAYAKGLVERYVTAPEAAWIRVHEDKPNNRMLYEIHEGGPGLSLLDNVLAALADGKDVRIGLTNERYAVIDDLHGELYSLIYPGHDALSETLPTPFGEVQEKVIPEHVSAYTSSITLSKVYQEGNNMPKLSAYLIIFAFTAFMVSGAAYTLVQAGTFDSDPMASQLKAGLRSVETDNPVWQLEKARLEAESSGKPLKFLKKDSKGWKWEMEQ